MGDLSDVELGLLRCIHQAGAEARLSASDIAPGAGLSLEQTTDRLNELEWVGYVVEHEGADGAASTFSLTSDAVDALTNEGL